ncbi:MAG: ribosome rescue GTPase HflX [Pseudomonadota bacterium]
MFERPRGGERAVLVHVNFDRHDDPRALEEFQELARSAGAEVLASLTVARHDPDPRYFIGSGKAEEIRQLVADKQAELVIFDQSLSPSQERNLEGIVKARVLDRTGLILDIFAQRAQSFEGKLQVELAQLKHVATRLVRGWTHLERQKGGIGLRGPGETQLETDRRLVGERIKQINRRLAKVRRHHDLGRKARQRSATPVVSLVGYTNAGKSTLFNALTQAQVYAADLLFATLDPTLRRLDLAGGGHVVLADTVGFIRDLPHELVAAFRSTLEETRNADVLLHVIDAADPERLARIAQVNSVLAEIDADQVPQIWVMNKIDLVPGAAPHVEEPVNGALAKVWVSAVSGAGLDMLRDVLRRVCHQESQRIWLKIPPTLAKLRAQLYTWRAVIEESVDEDGASLVYTELDERRLTEILAQGAQIFDRNTTS